MDNIHTIKIEFEKEDLYLRNLGNCVAAKNMSLVKRLLKLNGYVIGQGGIPGDYIVIKRKNNNLKRLRDILLYLRELNLIRGKFSPGRIKELNEFKLKINGKEYNYSEKRIDRRGVIELCKCDEDSSVFLINLNNGEEIYLANQDCVTLSKTIPNEFITSR